MGWSLDDKTEILSRDTLVKEFTLQRVVKSPAGFDPEKLDSYQSHWMGELSLDEKIDRWPVEPIAGAALRQMMDVQEKIDERAGGSGSAEGKMDPETLENLKALGYVD